MSEMGRCRDCRWWSPTVIAEGGVCRIASWHGDAWREDAPKTRKANAVGPDGRGPAALVTAPDFGCVQFEAKG